jgi:hypothetical protein
MNSDLRRRINRLAAAIARAEERCVRDFLAGAVTTLQDSEHGALIVDYLEAVERAEFAHDPQAWLAERAASGTHAPAPGLVTVAECAS